MGMRLSGIGRECGETGWKCEKCGESEWESKWKLSIAVEMTPNGNGNDKFKEWREVRITENVHTFVPHIWTGTFLVNFGHILHNLFVFIIDFEQVNTGWEDKVKWKIYVISILIPLVPLFRLLVFRVVFFSIFQFIGDTTLFRVTILKQTYTKKKQFSRWQRA